MTIQGVGVWAALLMVGVVASAQVPPRRSPEALGEAIQARYDRVRDFSADFVHTYTGGVLRKRLVERGTLQVKRPGRMKWTYVSPEEKVFVSDASQIYSYIPADRQVFISPMPAEDQATTAALFLAGKGRLLRDFRLSEATLTQGPPGTESLRLDPRSDQRDYDWLILVVDRDTLRLRSLVAADRQGGTSTFEFSGIKENTGLADSLFVFKIPRGVDVIRTGPSR